MALRASVIALLAASAWAEDRVVLTSGRELVGTITSENSREIHLLMGTSEQVLPRSQITSIARSPAPASALVPITTASAPVPASNPANLPVLRPGIVLIIRTGATLDAEIHKTGYRFPATLAEDAAIDGVVVLPKGTVVEAELSEAERGGRLFGRSILEVRVVSVEIDDRRLPITTDAAVMRGASETLDTVQRTGVGAVFGAIIDGSHGVGVGAGVGLSLSLLGKQDGIRLPLGTILDVRITAPFSRSAP